MTSLRRHHRMHRTTHSARMKSCTLIVRTTTAQHNNTTAVPTHPGPVLSMVPAVCSSERSSVGDTPDATSTSPTAMTDGWGVIDVLQLV